MNKGFRMESMVLQQSFAKVIKVLDHDGNITSVDKESGFSFFNFLRNFFIQVKINPIRFGKVTKLRGPMVHAFALVEAVHDVMSNDRGHESVHGCMVTGSAACSVLEKDICT